MTRLASVSVLTMLLLGCGGEKSADADADEGSTQATNALQAMGQAATMGAKIQKSTEDAAKFQADRKARGDTVVLSYTELQAYLPKAPDGYRTSEEPGGSMQSMGSFSMSDASQTYVGAATADGTPPTIRVKIADFGGTEGAYGMLAMPMMLDMRQEDAHRRSGTVKLTPAYTWATEEFNKDSKDIKLTSVTRFRYLITVEAESQRDDQTAMVKTLTEAIVRRFEDK